MIKSSYEFSDLLYFIRGIIVSIKNVIVLLFVFCSGFSQAQQKTYNVYIDNDNNMATGCTVLQPDFMTQFDGVDGYLSIETSGSPIAISSSLYFDCTGAGFDAGSAIVTSALGLNANTNGDDVFEMQMNTSDLGIRSSTSVKLYYTSESVTSSDIVIVNNSGGGIFFGVAFPIPTFSLLSLLLLLTLIVFIVAHKAYKNKVLILASVMLFSTVVWSMFTFIIDGDVSDWSSFTAINDPTGDNSGPGSFSDITQVFGNLEQDLFTARIDVIDVENQAPTAADVMAGNIFEDTPLMITLSGADLDGDALTFSVATPPPNGSVSVVTPINTTSASLIYTPNADFVGNDSFTYVANDGQANSVPVTVNITVDPVNDAPTFTSGGDVAVLEDSVVYSMLWATVISAGPTDENTQSTNFNIVSVTNSTLFSSAPVVDIAGNLSFTPAADAAGIAAVTINIMDDGGTANGGVDTSANITFDVIITDVNDVPSFTKGADETVLEDAGAQSVAGWATALSAGPASESGQTLSFNVSNNSNTLFSSQPAVSSTGTLTYTPAVNANGSATVTVSIVDDGGTANGGVDTSAAQMFTIIVTAVNDAPSFTSGGNVGVFEDSGAYSQAWASSLSAGPSDESAQTLNLNITGNTAPGLFLSAPSISNTGQLSFTPATNAVGVATVTVNIVDNGGIANGGSDTSVGQMFTITLNQVNDVPSFTKGADQTFNQDTGAHTINAWATSLLAGPANESGQTLSFNVSNNNNALFSTQPSVNGMGDLSFTSAMGVNGNATVILNIMDNGGTAMGGVDTSANQSFTITILNPPPAKADPSYPVTTNIQINTPTVSGLLSGATGTGTLAVGNAMNPAPTTTTGGGNLSINTSTGAFTYNPPAGLDTGTDTFVYKICNATQCSADISVTFNLSGTTTWFIVNSMTAGDGRLTTPFNSIGAFMAQQNGGMQEDPSSGDCIFLDAGNYTGPLSLITNQIVIGKGSSTTIAAECGISLAANSTALPTTGGIRPEITSPTTAINLSSGNTLRGFNIGNAVTKLLGSNFGLLTINNMALTGTGKAVDLTTGTVDVTLDSINSANSTSEGVDLSLVSGGSFTVTGLTTVDNAAGIGVNVSNVGAAYSFGNVTITNRNSAGVFINAFTGGMQNGSFGVITIANPNSSNTTALGIDNAVTAGSLITVASVVIDNNNSASSTIALSNNDGATININGGSVTGTGSVQPTVSISSSSGTVNYSGTITQNNTATALRVLNNAGGITTISGMITANTSTATAINLDTHGAVNLTGGLAITTTSGNAFLAINGGTINATGTNTITSTTGTAVTISGSNIGASDVTFQNVSVNGATSGIVLNNTGSGSFNITGNGGLCTLTNTMCTGGTIQNTSAEAITLTRVNGFNANFLRLVNIGNADNESAIEAFDQSGSFTFNNSIIENAADDGIELNYISAQTLATVTINNSQFEGIGDFPGGVYNSAAGNNFAGAALDFNIGSGATVTSMTLSNIFIRNFDGRGISIDVGAPGQGGSITGAITNADIDGIGTLGITVVGDGTGVANIDLSDSTIMQVDNSAALVGESNGGSNVTFAAARVTMQVINESFFGVSCKFIINDGNIVSDNPIFRGTFDNNNCTDAADLYPMTIQARGSQGRMDIQLTNNTFTANVGSFIDGSIIESGNSTAGESDTLCLEASGNNIDGDSGFVPGIGLSQNLGTTYILEGFAGTGTVGAQVEAFIDGLNPLSMPLSSAQSGFTGFVNYTTTPACNTPAVP